MRASGKQAADRRKANQKSLEVFGAALADDVGEDSYRTVHESTGPALFTIGYERRSGEDLIAALLDAGVEALVDVRQRPMSRKADFRKKALEASCTEAGVDYVGMPELGSTDALRDRLKETGDFRMFAKAFRQHVRRKAIEAIDSLAELASERSVALLCYERQHDECHRSVLATILAERDGFSVVAIR